MHKSIRPSVLAFLAVLASACVVADHDDRRAGPVVVREPGPPPHAPAHGYRRKHQHDGVDLVFDSGLGVYVVVNTPDCWWTDGGYYRWRDGAWSTGSRLSGPWTVIKVDSVPAGLRAHKGKKNGKGKGNGKGNSPASRKR